MDGDLDDPVNEVPQDGQADITTHWRTGDLIGFVRLFEETYRQKLRRYLIRGFRLSEEDAEDSIGDALRELFDRYSASPATVENPVGYITACAKYAALRHHEYWGAHATGTTDVEQAYAASGMGEPEVGEHIRDDTEEDGSGKCPLVRVDPAEIIEKAVDARVTELVEESLQDAEIEVSWAREIVGVAVTRLTATEAKVVGLFLARSGLYNASTNDFAIRSSAAQEELGMTADGFRQTKSRAFRKLKIIIPEVIAELGICLPARLEAELFSDRWPGPEEGQ